MSMRSVVCAVYKGGGQHEHRSAVHTCYCCYTGTATIATATTTVTATSTTTVMTDNWKNTDELIAVVAHYSMHQTTVNNSLHTAVVAPASIVRSRSSSSAVSLSCREQSLTQYAGRGARQPQDLRKVCSEHAIAVQVLLPQTPCTNVTSKIRVQSNRHLPGDVIGEVL
eukprot:3242-Heterococcus_DN1.PRE.2